MARVAVIGGSGFVGAHVVRHLVALGDEVTVLAPSPEPCLTDDDLREIDFHAVNATDADHLANTILSTAPQVVVGLAAYGGDGTGLLAAAREDEAAAFAVNVGGFRNLLAACRQAEVPRVLWSSSLVAFGPPELYENGQVAVDSPRRPETFYGLTKMLAEDIASFYRHQHRLNITAVRLPLVFGPGLWYQGVGAQFVRMFESAAAGKPVTLDVAAGPIDLLYVKDAAAVFGHLARFDGPLAPIYNLSAFSPRFADVAAVLEDLAPGFTATLREQPAPVAYPVMNHDALTRDTGFAPEYQLAPACADYLDALGGAPG